MQERGVPQSGLPANVLGASRITFLVPENGQRSDRARLHRLFGHRQVLGCNVTDLEYRFGVVI
jgi:hypothetical protein